MEQSAKPVPRGDGLNGEFYAYAAKLELRFQRCDDCGAWRHMPRYTCAVCGSSKWAWALSSGRGKLYSWTVTHRSFHPAFNDDVPYGVAVVELEEGVRMVSHIEELPLSEYSLDRSLRVTFRQRGDSVLPVFVPA